MNWVGGRFEWCRGASKWRNRLGVAMSRKRSSIAILTLGATLVSTDQAKAIVDTWLATPMGEARYLRRLAKIRALEQRQ